MWQYLQGLNAAIDDTLDIDMNTLAYSTSSFIVRAIFKYMVYHRKN